MKPKKETSNPYIGEGGNPELKPSLVAFIDVLGFREAILGADDEAKSQALLRKITESFSFAFGHLSKSSLSIKDKKSFFYFKSFSDNLVIGYPFTRDAEPELGSLLLYVKLIQMDLALAGFFVRGAIHVGDFFADANTVYGKGLIEAFDAERNLAVHPRIILTSKTKQYVDHHLTYYSPTSVAPQTRDLFLDSDGLYFVNYLRLLDDFDDGPFEDELLEHKHLIEKNLKANRAEPRKLSKYIWLANYHNYFCKNSNCFPQSKFFVSDQIVPLRYSRIGNIDGSRF